MVEISTGDLALVMRYHFSYPIRIAVNTTVKSENCQMKRNTQFVIEQEKIATTRVKNCNSEGHELHVFPNGGKNEVKKKLWERVR